MKKELLSIPEAAELLSCSTRTVRRLIEERTIEAYQEKNGLAEFKSSG